MDNLEHGYIANKEYCHKRRFNKMKKVLKIVLVLGIAILAIGCGKREAKSGKEKNKSVAKKETLKSIGMKTKTSNKMQLENKTNKDIVSFSVLYADKEAEAPNLINDSDVFKANEKRNLFFETYKDATDEENGKKITKEYIFRITYSDGVISDLHNIPVDDANKITIKFSEQVSYIAYKSLKTNQDVVTLEAEKAIVKIKEEEAQAEAEAQMKAQAEQEKATQETWQNADTESNNSNADEGCVGSDVLFN